MFVNCKGSWRKGDVPDLPGLDQAACIWKLMEHYVEYLESAADYIKHCHDKGGLGMPGVNRQRLEYIVMCFMIIFGFFSAYYEPTAFKDERQGGKSFFSNGLVNKSKSEVNKKKEQIDELFTSFYRSIKIK